MRHTVLGWRCAVDGAGVDISTPDPWRCPRATASDRHHVLHAVVHRPDPASGMRDGPTSFHRNDAHLAWAASAAARGMTLAARDALVSELDAAIAEVDGTGFHDTPFARSDALSDALGFDDSGGVWVKDETGSVGGSQKARHLFSVLLQLRANELLAGTSEADRAPLAIASCGNAALAAATLARAARWPIDVYVPTWMSDGFGSELDRLGARIHRCERRDDDPPGDPAMLRFREAVDGGAVPFTVQGPENALCLDGGRTIGWEMADELHRQGVELDALFVQVGGGAFAACAAAGLAQAGRPVPLRAVQAEGCAPLARAWERGADVGSRWSDVMTPWDSPSSLADGILDDETYDWLAVVDAMRTTGGGVVVAPEAAIEEAHRLAHDAGFEASPTGTAGLAGLLHERSACRISSGARVALVMSGVTR